MLQAFLKRIDEKQQLYGTIGVGTGVLPR
jgi:hypothetical protein